MGRSLEQVLTTEPQLAGRPTPTGDGAMLEGSASSTSSVTRPSPPLREPGLSHEVFPETLKALASASKGIEVLAECEPGVIFADRCMFLTVELGRHQPVSKWSTWVPQDAASPR